MLTIINVGWIGTMDTVGVIVIQLVTPIVEK